MSDAPERIWLDQRMTGWIALDFPPSMATLPEYRRADLTAPDTRDALIKDQAAEITRLRAALADAQAVGFAAGVEAAAKRCDAIAGNTADFNHYHRRAAGQCGAAIRALVCPELTAAAARVLLEDDAAMNTLSDYEHRQWAGWFRHQLEQSSPENIERWKRQADTPFALLSDEEKAVDRRFADAALRAIAGDTP